MKLNELMEAMRKTATASPQAVDVPEWGRVYVREITVAEIDEQTSDIEGGEKDRKRFARAAARIICDEKGNRIFDPANDEHVDLIAKQPWRLLRKVVEMSGGDSKKP
jgi:hypothetical protein